MLGARPGTVRAIYPVDIPHPRDVVALKSDPRFQAIHRELWADLGSRLSTHVLRPGRAA
jgi:ABC-type nitrate/sulfonate/bicarbonate transport system ATPase subunit